MRDFIASFFVAILLTSSAFATEWQDPNQSEADRLERHLERFFAADSKTTLRNAFPGRESFSTMVPGIEVNGNGRFRVDKKNMPGVNFDQRKGTLNFGPSYSLKLTKDNNKLTRINEVLGGGITQFPGDWKSSRFEEVAVKTRHIEGKAINSSTYCDSKLESSTYLGAYSPADNVEMKCIMVNPQICKTLREDIQQLARLLPKSNIKSSKDFREKVNQCGTLISAFSVTVDLVDYKIAIAKSTFEDRVKRKDSNYKWGAFKMEPLTEGATYREQVRSMDKATKALSMFTELCEEIDDPVANEKPENDKPVKADGPGSTSPR